MPVLNVHPTGFQPQGAAQPVHPADILHGFGLLLGAEVSVPMALANALSATQSPIPASITGQALIDTGATGTSIDEATAVKLGLQPVGQVQLAGIAGPQPANQYQIRVSFPGTPLPELELQVTGVNLASQNLTLLLGRDLLRQCVLIYNGPMGCFTLSF